jgi:hypothetical protein
LEKGESHQTYDLISGTGTELIRGGIAKHEIYDLIGNTKSAKGE